MMFLPNPGVLAAGAQGRTYADWVAHVMARSGNNNAVWDGDGNDWPVFRTQANTGPLSGVGLYGSPFLSGAGTGYHRSQGCLTGRIVQHCLPSEAVFDQQRASSRWLIVARGSEAVASYAQGSSRNGFTSQSYYVTEGNSSFPTVASIGWWDEATQSALMMNPQAGTGPVPYTAPGWS